MLNQFQSLDRAEYVVCKHFSRYPNASVSAMFRRLRKDKRYSLIGDYPIFSSILTTIKKLGIKKSRQSVLFATRQSKELKGKTIILRSLFNDE